MKFSLRMLYLYLFSFVGLLIVVIGGIRMVDLGLKTFVFTEADKYEVYPVNPETGKEISVEDQAIRQQKDLSRQRQREFTSSLSMIAIGLPLYLYHWKTIQKETKK